MELSEQGLLGNGSTIRLLEDKQSGIINIAYNDGRSEQVNYQPGRGYYNELVNFYRALNGVEEISVTPEIEYGDVKMVFDILKSVDRRETIYVDDSQKPRDIYHNQERPSTEQFIQ